MIDPYTAAKTAAVVAGLAVSVLGYMAKVRDAPRRAQQLRAQLRMTHQLAEDIIQLLKTKPQLPVASLEQALTEFQAILDELEERTRAANTDGLKKYVWPFTEDDTERYLSDIEHYKTAFISFFTLHNL
jgi:DNA repair exonuclease SbcCD ATPase subunit